MLWSANMFCVSSSTGHIKSVPRGQESITTQGFLPLLSCVSLGLLCGVLRWPIRAAASSGKAAACMAPLLQLFLFPGDRDHGLALLCPWDRRAALCTQDSFTSGEWSPARRAWCLQSRELCSLVLLPCPWQGLCS
jgi:hypothetical protein